jgi:predicted HTH transcriptional regulator
MPLPLSSQIRRRRIKEAKASLRDLGGVSQRRVATNGPPGLVISIRSSNNFFNIRFYKRAQDFDLRKLSARQVLIYQLFRERPQLTKREITLALKISEDSAVRDLKVLLQFGFIHKQGIGKAMTYRLSDG